MADAPPICGGCLCGALRYEIRGKLGVMANCHCSMCRKAHGAAFSTIVPTNSHDFRWLGGQQELTHYESYLGKRRWFCRVCGSQLISTRDASPDTVLIRAGSLEGDPGCRPAAHGHVAFKAPWHEIHDDLPQFEAGFPGSPPGPDDDREH